MIDYNFGDFLYELRTKKGLSQFQLAKLVGVSDKAVSKWECGISKPKSNILIDLCSVLDISVDELLAGRYFVSDEKADIKDKLWKKAHYKLKDKYGDNPNIKILDRYLAEFDILRNSDLIIYFDYLSGILEKARELGEYVRINGDLPSSFVAFVVGASDINSLKSHYYCPLCKKSEFGFGVNCGWDLPFKNCECGKEYIRDGFDIPISSVIDIAHKTPQIILTVSNKFMKTVKQFTTNYFTNIKMKTVTTHDQIDIKKFIVLNSEKNLVVSEEKLLKYPSITIYASDEFDYFRKLQEKTSVVPNMNMLENESIVSQLVSGNTIGIPQFRQELFEDMTALTHIHSFYDLIQTVGLFYSVEVCINNSENEDEKENCFENIISY